MSLESHGKECEEMLSVLREANKIVGAKQVLRALAADGVSSVYVATDADVFVTRRVYDACRERNIPVVEVPSMKALGEACGIEVKTAVAAIRR